MMGFLQKKLPLYTTATFVVIMLPALTWGQAVEVSPWIVWITDFASNG